VALDQSRMSSAHIRLGATAPESMAGGWGCKSTSGCIAQSMFEQWRPDACSCAVCGCGRGRVRGNPSCLVAVCQLSHPLLALSLGLPADPWRSVRFVPNFLCISC
jgi:hypothetical protein